MCDIVLLVNMPTLYIMALTVNVVTKYTEGGTVRQVYINSWLIVELLQSVVRTTSEVESLTLCQI